MGDVYCGEVVYEAGKTEYKVECGGIIGESVKILQEVKPLTLCEVQVEIQGNNLITFYQKYNVIYVTPRISNHSPQ